MFPGVRPEARALRTKHQRHPLRPERILEIRFDITGKADTPEPRVADLVERAREVDDTRPWNPFKSPLTLLSPVLRSPAANAGPG